MLRTLSTAELTPDEERSLRSLLDQAFRDDGEGFTDDDWDHARGGVHVLAVEEGQIVAHVAVVPRKLEIGGQPYRVGFVEAVATARQRQGEGHGTAVMAEAGRIISEHYQLGALSTGSFHFYERLGWRRFAGPSSVRTPAGEVSTPEDDGSLMVLLTPTMPRLDLHAPISCDWRAGDVW